MTVISESRVNVSVCLENIAAKWICTYTNGIFFNVKSCIHKQVLTQHSGKNILKNSTKKVENKNSTETCQNLDSCSVHTRVIIVTILIQVYTSWLKINGPGLLGHPTVTDNCMPRDNFASISSTLTLLFCLIAKWMVGAKNEIFLETFTFLK